MTDGAGTGPQFWRAEQPMTMTSEQWMDCLAHAWELGHLSLCRRHGVMPFEVCQNPYRVERASQ